MKAFTSWSRDGGRALTAQLVEDVDVLGGSEGKDFDNQVMGQEGQWYRDIGLSDHGSVPKPARILVGLGVGLRQRGATGDFILARTGRDDGSVSIASVLFQVRKWTGTRIALAAFRAG